MFWHRKPLATHLKPQTTPYNEVTVTIMSTNYKSNYHETFLMDLTKNNSFEFKGKTYNVPAEDTGHYPTSFWRFDIKLALFFERHSTLAKYFDVFNIKSRANYEVGYLYWEDNQDPEELKPPEYDWALENYMLQQNSTIEGAFKDADMKLKGSTDNGSLLTLIGVIVVGIVAAIVVIYLVTGQHHQAVQAVQNATSTGSPLPTGGVILPP